MKTCGWKMCGVLMSDGSPVYCPDHNSENIQAIIRQQLKDMALVAFLFLGTATLIYIGHKIEYDKAQVTITEIPAAVNATGPTVPLNTVYFSSQEKTWGKLCEKHGYQFVRTDNSGKFMGCQKNATFEESPVMIDDNAFKNPDGSWTAYEGKG